MTLQKRSLFRSDIQNLAGRYDPHFRSALFGTIDEHSLACYTHAFISTYNLDLQTSFSDSSKKRIGSRYATIARLPDINGRQKFVVFQYPNNKDNTTYTVRAHAILQPHATSQTNHNLSASITIGNQTSSNASIDIREGSRSVHIHDDTFSPNNMHLTGLPNRSLIHGEIFSFSSHVEADNGTNIDTFHMLLEENASALISKLATEFLRISMHEKVYYDQSLFDQYKRPIREFKDTTSSRGFGTFIEMLQSIAIKEKLVHDTGLPNFSEHLDKLINFIQQEA